MFPRKHLIYHLSETGLWTCSSPESQVYSDLSDNVQCKYPKKEAGFMYCCKMCLRVFPC